MKRALLAVILNCLLLSLVGCGNKKEVVTYSEPSNGILAKQEINGKTAGLETTRGWQFWDLDGHEESGTCTHEVIDSENDEVLVQAELKKGTIHFLITAEDGSVLYENTVSEENTRIKIEKSGNITLSYDTSDAVGEFTLYYSY